MSLPRTSLAAVSPLRAVSASPPGDQPGLLLTSAHQAMSNTLALARRVAETDTTITLHGETGTGKEVIARFIHGCSPRRARAFVAVNCGAIPGTLAESELFGHERGAFSGAVDRRTGHFESAHRGTLLLDEVSELPLPLQTRLLRVLQEGEVQRVGSSHAVSVDVRVIATTNRDLAAMVADGTFRRDLYYRLNVFPLSIPPLRERLVDLPQLCASITGKLRDRPVTLTAGALRKLSAYDFPGNVRELCNVLERALVLADSGEVQADDIIVAPSHGVPLSANDAPPLPENLEAIERSTILRVLNACDGNRTAASQRLGISVRTLRNRIRTYRVAGISVPAAGGA